LAIFAAFMVLAVYAAIPALAVHDTGRFQLDGDAATGTNTAGTPAATDDWDKVCYQAVQKPVAEGGEGLNASQAATRCGIGSATTGATETAWTAELNRSASIFTGGGSKDPQAINQWAWKDAGGLPDKDNLEHAYAARYSLNPSAHCPNDPNVPTSKCDLLFAGLDRFDNSGDAQNGVWFFQNKITTAGAKSGGGTGFTGSHLTNDILIVSDFSNGGGTSTITVYTWDPTCTATNKPFAYCADANLHTQESSDAANCKAQDTPTPVAGDAFCGIVNPSTITMPWSFTDKSSTPANGALNGEFYEEGINLSLLHLGGTCFSSVLSETRSSTSTTATLKDFILGQLGHCAPVLTTQASESGNTVTPGTTVTDTATITVSGATNPADPTGTAANGNPVTFYTCFDASATPACTSGGTLLGTGNLNGGAVTNDGIATAVSPGFSPTANGFYCFRATWPGDSNYGPFNPPLTGINNANECFQVLQIGTTTQTTPKPSTSVLFGSSVFDHALVTAAASGGGPISGSIKFFLCDPDQTTSSGTRCESPAGSPVPAAGTTVPVTAVSPATDPPTATADSATATVSKTGTWCWRAEFTPTGNVYTGSTDDTTGECFTVTDTSGGSSAQTWRPQDSATVSSTNGAPLNGTFVLTLHNSIDCSGAAVQTYTDTLTGTSSTDTITSNNQTSFDVTTTKSVSWDAVFTSSDPNVANYEHCEVTSLTITN